MQQVVNKRPYALRGMTPDERRSLVEDELPVRWWYDLRPETRLGQPVTGGEHPALAMAFSMAADQKGGMANPENSSGFLDDYSSSLVADKGSTQADLTTWDRAWLAALYSVPATRNASVQRAAMVGKVAESVAGQ